MESRVWAIMIAAGFGVCTTAVAQQSTGLIFADDEAYRSIPLASMPLLGTLPNAVDRSAEFPAPGQQGRQGSCVGWALAYAVKSYQENIERSWGLSTPSTTFSPAFVYNQIKYGSDCQGGSTFIDALNLVRQYGTATLDDFPYDPSSCSALPDQQQLAAASQFAISDWRRVNPQDEIEVKTHVASGHPVLIGMMVDDNFGRLGADTYTVPSGVNETGHAMVVVGYDDAREAFKVINSWGRNWGDGGFGWIGYQAFRQTVREGYVANDIVFRPPPAPSPPQDEDVEEAPFPQPPPVLVPQVQLGVPSITHNVVVPSARGPAPGMVVATPGAILNAEGRTLVLEARFNFFGGPSLVASPVETQFRDAAGLVAVGQSAMVGSDNENAADIQLAIPYYALNFAPTNGLSVHNLSVTVIASVDGQLLSQSMPAPFVLRW